jgi:hypothetical protein
VAEGRGKIVDAYSFVRRFREPFFEFVRCSRIPAPKGAKLGIFWHKNTNLRAEIWVRRSLVGEASTKTPTPHFCGYNAEKVATQPRDAPFIVYPIKTVRRIAIYAADLTTTIASKTSNLGR